jgi:hypothetical protein
MENAEYFRVSSSQFFRFHKEYAEEILPDLSKLTVMILLYLPQNNLPKESGQ